VTVARLQLHYFGHSISQAAHLCVTRIPLASMQGVRLRLNWCATLRAFLAPAEGSLLIRLLFEGPIAGSGHDVGSQIAGEANV
jgi:hypothetical protein